MSGRRGVDHGSERVTSGAPTGALPPVGALLCAITWERNGRRGGRLRPGSPRGHETTMGQSSDPASDPAPDAGVVFPAAEGGARSTSATGRAVTADAVRVASPALADEVLATTNWRSRYVRPYREMTRLALVRPGAATAISAAGLAAVHERFRFRRGGEDLPLSAGPGLAAGAGRALPTLPLPGTRPPRPGAPSAAPPRRAAPAP